jgi:hypothetical protein
MKRLHSLTLLSLLSVLLGSWTFHEHGHRTATTQGAPRAAPIKTPAAAQRTPIVVGVPATGQNAFEIAARVLQNNTAFETYGYLTRISGLPYAVLFSNTDPISHTDAVARFTFLGTANMTARTVISDVTTIHSVDAVGQLDFYYNAAPKTDFGDPRSFARGVHIATIAVTYHNTLNIQAPGMGLASSVADVTQMRVATFSIGGKSYRLGRRGLLEHLTATGAGRLLDPTHAVIDLAGDVAANGHT